MTLNDHVMTKRVSDLPEPGAAMADDLYPELCGNDTASFKSTVDGLLKTRLRDLKLPAEILVVFQARTNGISRAMMASWCLWVASMNGVLTVFDLFNIATPALWDVLVFRVVISMSFLASHLILKSRRLNRREHYPIILPCILSIICAGTAGRLTGEPGVAQDYLINALLVIVSGIMFVNIDLKFSSLLAGISAILIGGFLLTTASLAMPGRLQLVTLYSGAMLAMLQARKILNLYQHRLFLLNLRDEITAAEAASVNAQLSSIAYIDRLTDIPNRRYFDEVCAAMSETTKNLLPLSLCMIDIDHFKLLNDTQGHLQGDHCLRVIASTIRHNLRGKTDILVRYGGEEFLLLLPGTDIDRAADIAERVRVAIANLQRPNPGSPHGFITASIGVTVANAHPLSIETLVGQADRALYRAKLSGRNRVSV